MKKLFYQLVGFNPAQHSVKIEIFAGITTFLTMSYILAVNPLILSDAGMDKGAVFSATVISAAIATFVMAFYAKLPFALASGMGLNTFFAYTLILSMGYTWQEALAAVFIEGLIFILLTIFKVREAIIHAIPPCMRHALAAGIGLFVAYIGLKNGGIIVSNPSTLTTLGSWTPTTILAAAGILLGGILTALKIRASLFYTIIIITLVGIPLGVTVIPENFSLISAPMSIEPIAFKLDISHFLILDLDYYVVIFIMLFMDMFDTIGTLIGTATHAGMTDKHGNIPNLNRALMADAIGTSAGALCGTSIVTTFAESSTGITAGGRTGMTAFTVALLFLTALFFAPLFLIIPAAATTGVLVLVGIMMMQSFNKIDLCDFTEAVPCFITIITMPLTASISEGIALSMISYVIIKICTRRTYELSSVMYVLGALFLLKYIMPLL